MAWLGVWTAVQVITEITVTYQLSESRRTPEHDSRSDGSAGIP